MCEKKALNACLEVTEGLYLDMERKKCGSCGRKRNIEFFEHYESSLSFAYYCNDCRGISSTKPVETKKCIECKEKKPITDFNKRRSESESRLSSCKKCCALYQKKRRETKQSKDYQKSYQLDYRNTTEEERIIRKKRKQMEANMAADESRKLVKKNENVPGMFD